MISEKELKKAIGFYKAESSWAVVQCGSLDWRGKARSTQDAIRKALKALPETSGDLLRVKWGNNRWEYISFEKALEIAGYKVRKEPNGFSVEKKVRPI